MPLQITMIKAPGSVAASEKTHTFDGQGGTIGRGANNDLVLQDPDRFLSSQHCQIFCDAGHFFIIDLSTNGTFVNGSPEPLGKGGKMALGHGDTFEIGDYVFEVRQAGGEACASSPFDVAQDPGSSAEDFFSGSYSPIDSVDPFGSSELSGQDLGLVADIDTADPLAALDRAQSKAADSGMLADPFVTAPDSSPFSGSSYSDQGSAVNEAIAWPETATQNLIPEEWEEELGLAPREPSTADSYGADSYGELEAEPLARRQAEPVLPEPAASAQDVSGASSSPASQTPNVAEEPPASATPAPESPQARPVTTVPVAQAQPPVALDGLFKAMGLNAEKLSPEQMEQVGSEIGALMREVVAGMMQVLRSRSSIKNEFRMNVTTIQPVENNPLKFSADVDEALDNMFVRRSNAYKGSVDAIREGFQEIGEHQLAMIAGIRHGFEQMMTRFEPQTLESNFDKQGGSVLPGMKKGKYWSCYHDYYKNFTDNMEHSFQHLFGSDFVHAYEDQLRKLKMGRKKNT